MIVTFGFALLAASAAPLPAAEEKPATPAEERKICRRDDAVGTRLAPRVCLTKAEWKARDETQRERKRRLRDQADRGAPGS